MFSNSVQKIGLQDENCRKIETERGKMSEYKLTEGISVDNISEVHSAYALADSNNIRATLSAEEILSFMRKAVRLLEAPLFFFMEVPLSNDEEKSIRQSPGAAFHSQVYYLDNCTHSVIDAIVSRYGDLLINDGLTKFGFGSHKTSDELYFMDYQVINIYGQDTDKYAQVLEISGAKKESELITLWDCLSNDNCGERTAVELNGETVYDIVENLTEVGLYKSDIIEEQ